MIIFLYGPDTYRSRQKLNEIIDRYKNPAFGENLDSCGIKKVHKSGLNLRYFDGQTLDFQDFQDEIQQTSMFKEKKLLVLINVLGGGEAASNRGFKEKFLKKFKKFINSPEIILFYQGNEISRPDSLFNFLKKNAQSQEFKLLEGQKLKNWIKEEFESYRAETDPEVPEKLINFIGNDLWQIANEIKKLVSYCGRQRIKTKDVEFLVRPKIETDIFKTIDAIASKNKKQALFLIHKHLEKGDNPLYLLSMINFQFRNLLLVKRRCQYISERGTMSINGLAKELGIHPYVIRKTVWQMGKFSLGELKKIYQKIFQADLNIKTGKIDSQTALDMLIAEI